MIRRDHGPEAVLNVTGGFREKVKALTTGKGADIAHDPVGGDVFDESIRCIAFDGRLLVVGFTSGRIPTVSVNMPLIKGFSVMGVRAGEYGRRFPERGLEDRAAIWDVWRRRADYAHASMLNSRSRTGARPSSSSRAAKSSARR